MQQQQQQHQHQQQQQQQQHQFLQMQLQQMQQHQVPSLLMTYLHSTFFQRFIPQTYSFASSKLIAQMGGGNMLHAQQQLQNKFFLQQLQQHQQKQMLLKQQISGNPMSFLTSGPKSESFDPMSTDGDASAAATATAAKTEGESQGLGASLGFGMNTRSQPLCAMSFDAHLRLLLDPSEQLPRQLQLGKYAITWTNGEVELKGEQTGVRQLTSDELRQLISRLNAAPHDHVIVLNLAYNENAVDLMRELAPVAALKAVQVLILQRMYPPLPPTPSNPDRLIQFGTGSVTNFFDLFASLFWAASCAAGRLFSHAAGNKIGDSGCSALAGALPHLSALQYLDLTCNYVEHCFFVLFAS
jgi:hypothetical protein